MLLNVVLLPDSQTKHVFAEIFVPLKCLYFVLELFLKEFFIKKYIKINIFNFFNIIPLKLFKILIWYFSILNMFLKQFQEQK